MWQVVILASLSEKLTGYEFFSLGRVGLCFVYFFISYNVKILGIHLHSHTILGVSVFENVVIIMVDLGITNSLASYIHLKSMLMMSLFNTEDRNTSDEETKRYPLLHQLNCF